MIWWINHQCFFIVGIIQLEPVCRVPGATSNGSPSFLPLFSCCGDKNTTILQNSCLSTRSCCHGNRSLVAICLTISLFLLHSLFILWLSSCLIPSLVLSSIVLSRCLAKQQNNPRSLFGVNHRATKRSDCAVVNSASTLNCVTSRFGQHKGGKVQIGEEDENGCTHEQAVINNYCMFHRLL